jgi:hypothetical protein
MDASIPSDPEHGFGLKVRPPLPRFHRFFLLGGGNEAQGGSHY